MSGRAIFFLSTGGYEAAWHAASLGLTAAAMGDEVVFVIGFDALRALARGTFGKPLSERETAAATRGEGLGAPTPARMLDEARGMGARVLACDTTVKLCGLVPAELERTKKIDEVVGLPQIWGMTRGGHVLNF